MGANAKLLEMVYGTEGLGDDDKRRVPRAERKTHDLKSLHQGHHEVINLALLGYQGKEIAEKTGYTKEAVSLILGSRLAQLKLRQMRLARDGGVLDAAKMLNEELIPLAMKTYKRIMEAEQNGESAISFNLQARVAGSVLKDFSGLAAPKELRINGTMTHEVLDRITARGMAAARECGLIVDATEVQDAELVDESCDLEE